MREEKTHWADAHPALAVRIDAVRHLPMVQRAQDTRVTSTLVNIDLEAWLSDMLTNAFTHLWFEPCGAGEASDFSPESDSSRIGA